MARHTYAGRNLIQQVRAAKPKAKIETGDADGLGVYRTLRFDKATSKWLAPLLDEIDDPRIESTVVTDSGYLHLTFVATRAADDPTPFLLDDAAEVLKGEKSEDGE